MLCCHIYLPNYQYQDFKEIYNIPPESLYSRFVDLERKLIGLLIYEIDSQITKYKGRKILRNDTAYFLVINYHHMVILPFLFRNFPSLLTDDKLFVRVGNYLQSDISLIINEAIQDYERTRNEITSHTILNVINNLWKELQMMRLEIWG